MTFIVVKTSKRRLLLKSFSVHWLTTEKPKQSYGGKLRLALLSAGSRKGAKAQRKASKLLVFVPLRERFIGAGAIGHGMLPAVKIHLLFVSLFPLI